MVCVPRFWVVIRDGEYFCDRSHHGFTPRLGAAVVSRLITFEKPIDVHGKRGTVDWVATSEGHS